MASFFGRFSTASHRRGTAGACATALGIAVAIASCSGEKRPPTNGNVPIPFDDAGSDATTAPTVDASPPPSDGATPPTDASSEAAPLVCGTPEDAADVNLMMCGTRCVNTDTDNNNCGGCAQPCGAVAGTTCDQGTCQCPTPQIVCSAQCVDVTQDPSNCGFCGHNCQGNPCMAGLCQASTIATVTASACLLSAIAVDSTMVYWTQGPIQQSGCIPGTFGKPFAGGATVTFGGTNDPRGVVVNLSNVFWVDYSDGSVDQAPIMGGSSTSLVEAPDAAAAPAPVSLAIDSTNVYWVDYAAGTVNQMPIGGGTITTLASGRGQPNAIAVDAHNVYWVDYGTVGIVGSVNKVPIGQPNVITTLATSETQAYGIAVDATSVYWTVQKNPGVVKSIGINGQNLTTLAQGQGAPTGIAVDSQYVYWTNYDDNTVLKVPIVGGKSFTLASVPGENPSSIAVDAKNVYWANRGAGNILKVAK